MLSIVDASSVLSITQQNFSITLFTRDPFTNIRCYAATTTMLRLRIYPWNTLLEIAPNRRAAFFFIESSLTIAKHSVRQRTALWLFGGLSGLPKRRYRKEPRRWRRVASVAPSSPCRGRVVNEQRESDERARSGIRETVRNKRRGQDWYYQKLERCGRRLKERDWDRSCCRAPVATRLRCIVLNSQRDFFVIALNNVCVIDAWPWLAMILTLSETPFYHERSLFCAGRMVALSRSRHPTTYHPASWILPIARSIANCVHSAHSPLSAG